MKKILSLVLLLIPVFVFSQEMDCEKMKYGKFVYKEIKGAYSVRKGNKQTSFYADSSINEFEIKWVSNCSFEMTFISSTNPSQKTYIKGDKVNVDIIKVEEDCYQFVAYFKGREFPPTYMCKVSNVTK